MLAAPGKLRQIKHLQHERGASDYKGKASPARRDNVPDQRAGGTRCAAPRTPAHTAIPASGHATACTGSETRSEIPDGR